MDAGHGLNVAVCASITYTQVKCSPDSIAPLAAANTYRICDDLYETRGKCM